MPLYTFNYTSPVALGEARPITQVLQMPDRPPRGTRFYIRQVSATSTDSLANSFRFVNIFIPELMEKDNVQFVQYTADANGILRPSYTSPDGFRYYLTDPNTPLAVNVFPDLNLGRHFLQSHQLTLQVSPMATSTIFGSMYAFSVVVEWNTE